MVKSCALIPPPVTLSPQSAAKQGVKIVKSLNPVCLSSPP